MKLRAQGFQLKDGLVGTIVVLTDDGEPTGVEHTGNYSKSGGNQLLKKVMEAAFDPEECHLLLVQLLRELREQADGGGDGADLGGRPTSSATGSRRSQASVLVDLAMQAGIQLFHDDWQEPYAVLPLDRREIWPIGSKPVKRWLTRLLWITDQKAPSRETLAAAVGLLSAVAVFDGPEHPLHIRVAWHEGALYYDLGDWRAVMITADGWEIVEDPPVLFRHYAHQLAQPEPQVGGGFNRIFDFLSPILSEDDALLIGVAILTDIIPGSPRPAVSFAGPQGSGKTTTSRVMKRLIDPSKAKSIRRIADFRELQLQLEQNWLLNIDNITNLKPEISDALAAAITGDSDLRRQLYTDQDLLLLDYMRPMVLNGITHPAERPDLLDRTILVTLARINHRQRREEEEFWPLFEEVLSGILGGAFDIISKAMSIRPTVRLAAKPRMADFAAWGYAIAEAADWSGSRFISAYERNILRQHEEAVASSLVAQVVVRFMENRLEWQGTPTETKLALDNIAAEQGVDPNDRRSGWPGDASRLSKELHRLAETLTGSGIEVTFPAKGHRRSVRFLTLAESTVGSVGDVGKETAAEGSNSHFDVNGSERTPYQNFLWDGTTDGTDGKKRPVSEPWSEEL